MKKLILLMVLFLCGASLFAQHDPYIQQYLERLENSKKYLLVVAEAMPEDKYDYRVTPESMSFEEHLMHIAWAMDWHSQSLMGGRKRRDWNTETELKVGHKSKGEIMDKVAEIFDITIKFIKEFESERLGERLDYFGANRTKMQILMILSDHITHHRGQMLVSMRMNGLVPPRYVLFQ